MNKLVDSHTVSAQLGTWQQGDGTMNVTHVDVVLTRVQRNILYGYEILVISWEPSRLDVARGRCHVAGHTFMPLNGTSAGASTQ